MNFKKAIQWIKHNPIAVVAIALCLASLVFLLVVRTRGKTFIEELGKRAAEVRRIDTYRSTAMRLPPEQVDGVPRVVNGAVNQSAIDYLKTVFSQMQGDYGQIWELAVKHNRGDATRGMHLPMIEGLFPDPGFNEYRLYDARRPYLDIFREMLGPAAQGAIYPRLNAGGPVSQERIAEVAAAAERTFRARHGLGENESLSEARQAELVREQRRVVVDLLRQHARSIHVYVMDQPFQIGPWAISTDKPLIEEIWESQMDLWIQQDIVQTISRTNRVSTPSASVIEAPIKRLHKITVVPGYVGINSTGGLVGSRAGLGEVPSGDSQMQADFSFAPTGRRSNTLYDVRHAWVEMDVDIQQLPAFMDELVQTNFMTVLKVEMENVNEYDLTSQGYFMGSADVVHVRMLIETLWLRAWLAPMMPKSVRETLGIPEVATDASQSAAR